MYTLGIDIGSTTSKCVILRDGEAIVAKSIELGGLGTDGPEAALEGLWRQTNLSKADIARTTVTGYGRMNYKGGDDEASELTCHALGGRLVYPELRTVIDIGGQDAKVISLTEDGRMSNFVMNDKCAAGTGRFLDVMANILKMDVNDFGACAAESTKEVAISSTCTVFAESEVISQLANGVNRADLVAGICDSVAVRVAALARRVGVKELVCMSGGVAKNEAVRRALSKSLEVEIAFDPLAQFFGAIGAARYSYNKIIKQQR